MRLFIADDNVPFRTRLASVLACVAGIEVVGQSGDVPGTIEAIERTDPDTVILDIHMPGGSGLDVLHAIKASRRSRRVIMLTVGPKSEYETTSYLTGADYFFEKSSDLRKMAKMLRTMARKELA
jgi:DNA-binding NarL/FixJ family response regulator